MSSENHVIGLISDTHGLLRQSAAEALEGVERIIHAGDIDNMEIYDALNSIAPVSAVRGNMDFKGGVSLLPDYETVRVGNISIGVIHDRLRLKVDPAAEGLSTLVYGHSHRPAIHWIDGILFINPGSAGPRRFRLPVTVGILKINENGIDPRIVEIAD